MYGTIFRMKVKPGQTQAVADMFKQWDQEVKPAVDGAVAGNLMKPDRRSDELIGVAIFRDEQSYRANAENPKQNEWFQSLREQLIDDPEWEDGEYLVIDS